MTDEQGRPNRSEITVWVSGGQRPPAREVEQEEVTLIPDKKDYQPGDMAEILVQAPFYPAEGLVTLRRSGIVRSERITLDGPTYTLKVPIDEQFIPNVHVQVDLVGAAARMDDAGEPLPDAPKRPAYATGELNLKVPPLARTLALEVSPRDAKLEPGGKTTVDVNLRDAQGKPVEGAEVAVVVVDEAVLALTNYDPADPVSIFYAERSPDVSDYHTRSQIVLASPEDLMAAGQEGAAGARAMMATSAPGRGPDAGDDEGRCVCSRSASRGWRGRPGDRAPHRFQPAGRVRAGCQNRCPRARPGRSEAARQPDPLPGDCGGGGGRQGVRQGRVHDHRPPAADGPALAARAS